MHPHARAVRCRGQEVVVSDEGPGASGGEGGDGQPREAPLSDLAERVAERRERGEREGARGRFAEQSFEALDAESIWDDPGGSEFGAVGEVVEEGGETFVVDKGNFCERCRHFSAPPEVRCTHPGTEIREFVDKEHVRVSSCPVVEERGVDDGPVG